MGTFFEAYFLKIRTFCLVAPSKSMSFLTISNENFSHETQSPRLGAVVAPSKGLKLTLLGKIGTKKVSRII